jgi:hypothetical protein
MWGNAVATSRKVAGSIPDEVIGFFNWPNPSSLTMALGSTQPLTEMNTRNLPGVKGRPARGADNLTAICEPTVQNRGRRTFLGITPKYICVQRYYPLDLKVRKNELIAFEFVAYAMIIILAY